tara:strand:- start:229 stop:357 length:129 start_codon:yes stop_codon:yes gene_type:complete
MIRIGSLFAKFIFSFINQGLRNGYIEKSKWIYGEFFLDQEDV